MNISMMSGAKKKIAVLLSGLPRTFRKTAPALKEYLKDYEVDYFIATWDIIGKQTRHEKKPWKKLSKNYIDSQARLTDQDRKELEEIYQPKKLWIGEYSQFLQQEFPSCKQFIFSHDCHLEKLKVWNSFYCQFFQFKRVVEIFQEYLAKMEVEYDLVFRLRLDNIVIKNKTPPLTDQLFQMAKDKLVVREYSDEGRGFTDQFCFGSVYLVCRFHLGLFDFIKDEITKEHIRDCYLGKDKFFIAPEYMLKIFCRAKQIPFGFAPDLIPEIHIKR